jgi:hypothetical protein
MEFFVRRPVHATADEIHRALNRSDRASRRFMSADFS